MSEVAIAGTVALVIAVYVVLTQTGVWILDWWIERGEKRRHKRRGS